MDRSNYIKLTINNNVTTTYTITDGLPSGPVWSRAGAGAETIAG